MRYYVRKNIFTRGTFISNLEVQVGLVGSFLTWEFRLEVHTLAFNEQFWNSGINATYEGLL